MDIAGGNKGDKIVLCHKGNTLTMDASAVPAHLKHGDMLGSCPGKIAGITNLANNIMNDKTGSLSVKVFPNPSMNYFDIKINGNEGNNVKVNVYDLLGRNVETKYSVQSGQTLRLGALYAPGVYTVEILQGAQKQTVQLVKRK